jgi:hypothetical protein
MGAQCRRVAKRRGAHVQLDSGGGVATAGGGEQRRQRWVVQRHRHQHTGRRGQPAHVQVGPREGPRQQAGVARGGPSGGAAARTLRHLAVQHGAHIVHQQAAVRGQPASVGWEGGGGGLEALVSGDKTPQPPPLPPPSRTTPTTTTHPCASARPGSTPHPSPRKAANRSSRVSSARRASAYACATGEGGGGWSARCPLAGSRSTNLGVQVGGISATPGGGGGDGRDGFPRRARARRRQESLQGSALPPQEHPLAPCRHLSWRGDSRARACHSRGLRREGVVGGCAGSGASRRLGCKRVGRDSGLGGEGVSGGWCRCRCRRRAGGAVQRVVVPCTHARTHTNGHGARGGGWAGNGNTHPSPIRVAR